MQDDEANRFSARASRYARLGANAGALAARIASSRVTGARGGNAEALARALGSLKGPLMKVAQMMATIPEALPADYAEELIKLQSQAPPMGAAFVRRRMQAELGADWRARFSAFDLSPAAAASLGQVHRATSLEGEALACKLQYPDMASAVEADLVQLDLLFSIHRRMGPAIDTREIAREIGARIREELDYVREARLARLYQTMLAGRPRVRVPRILEALSTRRLLTMQWLDGGRLTDFQDAPAEARNTIAMALFEAWWLPFSQFGVIHGDPHLGNYTVVASGEADQRRVEAVNLFDYGCVRIFPAGFVGGVVELYEGLKQGDEARVIRAYEILGLHPAVARDDRGAEHLGALHLRAVGRGPRAQHRRRRQARRIRPPRGLRGGARPQGAGAAQGAARIRVHGPRRDRPRRRLPAPRRRAQLPPPVRGGDRGLQGRGGRRSAGGRARGGRPRRVGIAAGGSRGTSP